MNSTDQLKAIRRSAKLLHAQYQWNHTPAKVPELAVTIRKHDDYKRGDCWDFDCAGFRLENHNKPIDLGRGVLWLCLARPGLELCPRCDAAQTAHFTRYRGTVDTGRDWK